MTLTSIDELKVIATGPVRAELLPGTGLNNPSSFHLDSSGPGSSLTIADPPMETIVTTLSYIDDFHSPRVERNGTTTISPEVVTATGVEEVTLRGNDDYNAYIVGTLPVSSSTTCELRIECGDGGDQVEMPSLPANVIASYDLGPGSDSANLGGGTVSVDGGPDADSISDGNGDATILGGEGDDFIFPAGGDDVVDGGPGADYALWRTGDGSDSLSVDELRLEGNFNVAEQRVAFLAANGPGGTTRAISWAVGIAPPEQLAIGPTQQVTVGTGLVNDTVTVIGWDGSLVIDELTIQTGSGGDTVDLRGFGSNAGISSLVVQSLDGSDLVYTAGVPTSIFADSEDDELVSGNASDLLDAGSGNDIIRLALDLSQLSQFDTVLGGAGDDTVRYIPPSLGGPVEFRPATDPIATEIVPLVGSASPFARIRDVERIEVSPPLGASGGTAAYVRFGLTGITSLSFPGTPGVGGDKLQVTGTDSPEEWIVDDGILQPAIGPRLSFGVQVEEAIFDLAGGNDTVSTNSSSQTTLRFLGGDGDADEFVFRPQGLATTIITNGSEQSWQQPGRAEVIVVDFEEFPEDVWLLY